MDLFYEILVYLGFVKIAGTTKSKLLEKKTLKSIKSHYDKNSPFYILKKLQ